MKVVVGLLLLLVMPAKAMSADRCAINEAALLGVWRNDGATGSFQEFELQKAEGVNTFNSWLHQRPELLDATWTLSGCLLVVTPGRDESPPFRFRLLELKGERLRMRDEANPTDARYTRVQADR